MSKGIDSFTLGVEEEYQIVDSESRELVARQAAVLPVAERQLGDAVQPELQTSMIEIATPVCATLADVRRELEHARHNVIAAARQNGSRIAAAGTHPFSAWHDQALTPKTRYQQIGDDFGLIARETVIFGCHVDVGMESADVALDVLNRVRSQLSPLLALTANSPFWLGADTQYSSFRTEVWSRWPLSGPPLAFESKAEYDELIARLITSGIIEDETKIYWDVRPSGRFPTLEFRVTDVCMTVDEAVMLAGLVRAIARRAYLAGQAGDNIMPVRHELVRAAHWQAARYGLGAELIDVRTGELVRAEAAIDKLIEDLHDALDEAGDYAEIAALVRQTLDEGNGAQRQRNVLAQAGRFEDVVDYIVAQTELSGGVTREG